METDEERKERKRLKKEKERKEAAAAANAEIGAIASPPTCARKFLKGRRAKMTRMR